MFITIDKISFNPENFNTFYVKLKPILSHNLFLFEFLKNWFQEKYSISIYTSGTTSSPKQIFLKKESLIASANQTIDYLKLKDENIFCCIPINKIGGLMMIVRALTGNFDISVAQPIADPMTQLEKNHSFTFISLVPYQLSAIFLNEESVNKLNCFKTILIGGNEINDDLLNKIDLLKPCVYHTFGMTETCSNFALKKLNNEKWKYFKPYNSVKLKTDKSGILSVCGSQTNNKWIKTNDIVKIYVDGFEFYGRNDFVINTGGYKVSPEFIENKISNILQSQNFIADFVVSSKDSKEWGQMIVLVHHNKHIFDNFHVLKLLKSNLEKYEMPKEFICLNKLPRNKSMKIDRKKLREMIS